MSRKSLESSGSETESAPRQEKAVRFLARPEHEQEPHTGTDDSFQCNLILRPFLPGTNTSSRARPHRLVTYMAVVCAREATFSVVIVDPSQLFFTLRSFVAAFLVQLRRLFGDQPPILDSIYGRRSRR